MSEIDPTLSRPGDKDPKTHETKAMEVPVFGDIPEDKETVTLKSEDFIDDPLVGAQIGNYHIQSILGKGGFGCVYRAKDLKLGRDIALKFLHGDISAVHTRSFAREAKALAALSKHPNILQIHAWGEYNEKCYLALEFVDESVNDLITRSRRGLAPVEALRIVLQAAEGLSYAHKNGVLHRDIKPGNILIEGEEHRVKLADFGLARLQSGSDGTLVTGISGSPPYMSPEQACAGEVDERTDLYSLGVTLYELLSGCRPYEGDTASDIIRAVQRNEGVPLKKYRPDLHKSILSLVEKATAHDPKDRFQDCESFIQELHNVLEEVSGEVVPRSSQIKVASPPKRLYHHLVPLAAVLLLGIALIYFRPNGENEQLSAAIKALNSSQPIQAASLFGEFLSSHPQNDTALYGLGYAQVQTDKYELAKSTFNSISDESRKLEGFAAVAYAANESDVGQQVEKAAELSNAGYALTLKALLAIEKGEIEKAREILEENIRTEFVFDWQYARTLQLLGQLYYRLGDYEKAYQFLQDSGEVNEELNRVVREALIAEINDRQQKEKREQIHKQLERLKELREAAPSTQAPTPEEKWTSRPLTVVILDLNGSNLRFPVETGLDAAFPVMLERELLRSGSIQLLNRSLLDSMLQERELAYLLEPEHQNELARFLTAKILVRGEFSDFMGPELYLKIIDAETSNEILGPELLDLEQYDVREIVRLSAKELEETLRAQYPLKGVAEKTGDEWRLNIGTETGVAEDMQFHVSPEMSTNKALPDITAIITELTGDSATIRLKGDGVDELDGKLFLWQVEA